MIELDIVPEFFKSGLKMKNGEYLDEFQLAVPIDLFNKIRDFTLKATRIYGMGDISKTANWEVLFYVDELGFRLKRELEKSLQDSSIRYFSPSLNDFMEYPPEKSNYEKKTNIIHFFSNFLYNATSDDDWKEFAEGEN